MKNGIISFLIIATMVAVTACSSNPDTSTSPEEAAASTSVEGKYELSNKQFQSSGMELGKLETKEFHEVVKAIGMFDVPPENRAAVSSYFGGTVKKIQLLTGEQVKKGQTLFVLENPEYVQIQQAYLEAKGQLTYLKSDYERQKNLARDNITSQKNYLKAESEYTMTRVKLESLGKQLKLMNLDPNQLTLENIQTTINIPSPISGYVTQINITTGTYLNPAQMAITIVNTDHLHLELNIFERDLSKVRIGQPIKFRIQQDDSKEYSATVHLVNKIVDPQKRTIGLHGHLMDEKHASWFNPGMYVEAEIYTASTTKKSLPQSAVVEIEGKYFVLMVESEINGDYTLAKKEVTAGISNNGYMEILNANDFAADTDFLVSGAFNLITE